MELFVILDRVKELAASDETFREALLKAYESDAPTVNFCKVCNERGIDIYPMDIAEADESVYAAMRRSTNGGGENSPHLGWEENVFEALIEEIRG